MHKERTEETKTEMRTIYMHPTVLELKCTVLPQLVYTLSKSLLDCILHEVPKVH